MQDKLHLATVKCQMITSLGRGCYSSTSSAHKAKSIQGFFWHFFTGGRKIIVGDSVVQIPRTSPFGWNILDTNLTVGGLLGYSSVNSIVSLKVPSSKGVSWGLQNQIKVAFKKKTTTNKHGNSTAKLHLILTFYSYTQASNFTQFGFQSGLTVHKHVFQFFIWGSTQLTFCAYLWVDTVQHHTWISWSVSNSPLKVY